MSLITELIERLRKEADGYIGKRTKRSVRVKHILREAADTIETLSAKVQAANMERSTAYYNGGWIPVSEKLPEENKTVIASTDYFAIFPEARYTKDGWEWAYESGADYWEELKYVIAWMPLPAPYEPQKESEEQA